MAAETRGLAWGGDSGGGRGPRGPTRAHNANGLEGRGEGRGGRDGSQRAAHPQLCLTGGRRRRRAAELARASGGLRGGVRREDRRWHVEKGPEGEGPRSAEVNLSGGRRPAEGARAELRRRCLGAGAPRGGRGWRRESGEGWGRRGWQGHNNAAASKRGLEGPCCPRRLTWLLLAAAEGSGVAARGRGSTRGVEGTRARRLGAGRSRRGAHMEACGAGKRGKGGGGGENGGESWATPS